MARFAFVSTCTHPWGGSEELWSAAAARLAGSGHTVEVLKTAIDDDQPRLRALRALGCHLLDLHKLALPASARLPRTVVRLGATHRMQRAVRPLVGRHLRRFRPDLVIVSQGGNFDGLLYSDLCRAAGLPFVLISQKASEHQWPSPRARVLLRAALRAARRCYFVSRHNLRLTETQIGASLPNAEVVRNPFLVSGTVLPWPPRDDDTVRLACVARLEPAEKGQDILLQVLARERWRGRPLSVSFFGRGVHDEALRELAATLRVDKVAFRGFAADIEAIWRSHDALVLPSRAEGLPLALVEAMQCGRFGIVTDEGGSAEIVEDGRTGFVAAAAKVDAFDAAMERAWEARPSWPSIGAAARAAVQALVPADPSTVFTAKLLDLAAPRG